VLLFLGKVGVLVLRPDQKDRAQVGDQRLDTVVDVIARLLLKRNDCLETPMYHPYRGINSIGTI